ncbi:MAG: hypothetical protein WBI82_14040 [Sphaerochaeta sp.]
MAKVRNEIPYTKVFTGDINRVVFLVWGDSVQTTKIYKFIDQKLSNKSIDKIIGVLGYIDQTFPDCSHAKKFKHLVDDLWEIKSGQIRIACVWRNTTLIGVYGIIKKCDAWPSQELKNAQSQRDLYFEKLK